jgi:hypothetical protein
MASTLMDAAPPVPRGRAERPLYGAAALVAALVVVAGFAPTYYLKSFFGAADLSTLKHVHGVVMTCWFVLFFVQARLAATGRIAIHRQLGVAGIFLAVLVVAVGTMLGIAAARAGVAPVPGISPLVFLVLPIGEMVAFTVLFSAAIALRKRTDYHKRLMLLASVAMLTPAFARLATRVLGAGGPPVFFGLTDLVIIGCIAYDTVKNRRLHPAFVGGLVFVVVVQFGRLAVSQTALWNQFAAWLVG